MNAAWTLLGVGDAETVQEAQVFRRRLRLNLAVRCGTRLLALFQGVRCEEHAVASGAPEVHHHMPVTGETNFQDAFGRLSAITGKLHGSITHGSVISWHPPRCKCQIAPLVLASYRAGSTSGTFAAKWGESGFEGRQSCVDRSGCH